MIIIGELINASRKAIKAAIEAQDAAAIQKVAKEKGLKLVLRQRKESGAKAVVDRMQAYGFFDSGYVENINFYGAGRNRGDYRKDLALAGIWTNRWGGFVFINMDPHCGTLEAHLGDLTRHFARWPLEDRYKEAHVAKVMDCNWKVAVEAFQEVYHFRFIHDRGGFTNLEGRGATMGLLEGGNSRMVVPFSKQMIELLGQ